MFCAPGHHLGLRGSPAFGLLLFPIVKPGVSFGIGAFPEPAEVEAQEEGPCWGHWGTPALSGWLSALLCPGPASQAGHTE